MKKVITITAIALFAIAPTAQAGWFGGNTEACLIQKVEQAGTDSKVEQAGTDSKVEQAGTDNKSQSCEIANFWWNLF